jgi:glycosyltransferase involved in cell wall biosynthesis
MTLPPTVAVGLPVHNDPAGLLRSVPTVFGQTWGGPIRLIVVDDGSTDATPEVLKQLEGTYPAIEIVRNDVNQGRPAARNKIVELAGDDYLAWLDAGDLWTPRKLELQLTALREAERERPGDKLLCVGPFRWTFSDRSDERIRVPEVAGDQLYNLLTGTVFPYLQAIVGRAEHFRTGGGFDVRLKRRQDHDFLVRFLADGGEVVSSPPTVPVFTYLKSDVGSSPAEVAEANRILRRKHREIYRRYGRKLSARVRSNQHRLVARFYRHNGRTLRASRYEALAGISAPSLLARQVVRKAASPRQVARKMSRLPTRAVRPLLPVLQRTEVMEFARKVGIFRVIAATGMSRNVIIGLKSEVEETSGASPRPTLKHGEIPPEIEELEHEVAAAEATPVGVWLRLEHAYRKHSLLFSAEFALHRGIVEHPENAQLRVRLIELLALRRRWDACVEAWDGGAGLTGSDLRGLTYARVARSYRELGQHARGLEIAEVGAKEWSDDFRIAEEIFICRAALVDWKHALTGSGDVVGTAHGLVTDLGFLAGREGPMYGRVVSPLAIPPRVSLVVNGMEVAATEAARPANGESERLFSLSCHDLLRYLGDGDVIGVEVDGQALPIDGKGTKCSVRTGYPSRFRELKLELASGHVFTKFGALRMGNTPERRKHTLALFDEVSALIKDLHGYPTYPFYGNLLGAIREHDFIAHDAGGFDMGYISQHHDAESVRAEFLGICRALIERGYSMRIEPWSAYVRPSRTARVFVDVNYGWFTTDGELHLSFGWRHNPVTDRDGVLAPRECLVGDQLVAVPGNAEDVLEQIYGPLWPVPDQGFVLGEDIRRDKDFLLTPDEMAELEAMDPDRVTPIYDHHPALS